MSIPFIGFDDVTAAFYRRIIANAILNVHAVRMGYFDTFLCETDDPKVALRWQETVLRLGNIIREKHERRD